MTDVFFFAKINDAAKRLGNTVELIGDKATALDRVQAQPALVIFDLNCASADPLDLLTRIKADPATKDIPTIGFVSHVQTDLIDAARRAGCDQVLARSAFARDLSAILARYATTSRS